MTVRITEKQLAYLLCGTAAGIAFSKAKPKTQEVVLVGALGALEAMTCRNAQDGDQKVGQDIERKLRVPAPGGKHDDEADGSHHDGKDDSNRDRYRETVPVVRLHNRLKLFNKRLCKLRHQYGFERAMLLGILLGMLFGGTIVLGVVSFGHRPGSFSGSAMEGQNHSGAGRWPSTSKEAAR